MSTLKVDGIRSNAATSDAITLADNGTCTANITNNLSNRNLIINGAMMVAQRGTSSTSAGHVVDRVEGEFTSLNESPTYAQVDVASGTTPYTLGFRKALKITNGNQTSGAGAGQRYQLFLKLEGQDVANSGWNYTSSSSYITLSFWVKSSVAQNFYGYLRTKDGTGQRYCFETGSLSADTWTKITKTIPGNSNITIDNDTGEGLQLNLSQFFGTDYTDSGVSLNAWGAYASGTRTPDQTTTWYTTNDATLEYTGVQLEVGSVATDFEHRSYGQELALCQRYYYRHATGADASSDYSIGTFACYQANDIFGMIDLPVTMRATPSIDQVSGSGYYKVYSDGGSDAFDSFGGIWSPSATCAGLNANSGNNISGRTSGHATFVKTNNTNAYLAFSAEL